MKCSYPLKDIVCSDIHYLKSFARRDQCKKIADAFNNVYICQLK